jgi:ferredoxin
LATVIIARGAIEARVLVTEQVTPMTVHGRHHVGLPYHWGMDGALLGDTDPATQGGYQDHPPRMGFFTDTSVCIGCKACEVACKTWNAIPEDGLVFTGMSMDNSQGLGASTWRHVAFIEQRTAIGAQDPGVLHGQDVLALAGQGSGTAPGQAAMTPTTAGMNGDFRWLMASDVCKHCTHAAAWTAAPPGRCSAPSSAPWWYKPGRVLRHYARDPQDGVGGDGAFFLLLDEPEVYGLPPDPVVITRDLPSMWNTLRPRRRRWSVGRWRRSPREDDCD